jgi:hypothetical protein
VASFTATGANTFSWSSGNFGPVIALTPTAPATYTVIGKTNQNCISTKTISVALYSLTVVSAATTSASICAKESVTLSANGAVTYTWLPFNTTGSVSIVAPSATIKYTLIGRDANGCEGADTVKVTVNKCTGINETSFIYSSVKLYPNPSNGHFTIEMPFDGSKQIAVYNMTGELISEVRTSDETQKVNLSEVAKGVYFIQINASGSNARYKVIVE